MGKSDGLNGEILLLTEAIGETPDDAGLYFERGKLYYRQNDFGRAMNDFLKTKELNPAHPEAEEYVRMVCEILEFRYKDIYNP